MISVSIHLTISISIKPSLKQSWVKVQPPECVALSHSEIADQKPLRRQVLQQQAYLLFYTRIGASQEAATLHSPVCHRFLVVCVRV